MNDHFLRLCTITKSILVHEEGQDLPEYALTFVTIALGTVAGMNSIAHGVSVTFSAVANTLTTAV